MGCTRFQPSPVSPAARRRTAVPGVVSFSPPPRSPANPAGDRRLPIPADPLTAGYWAPATCASRLPEAFAAIYARPSLAHAFVEARIAGARSPLPCEEPLHEGQLAALGGRRGAG